MRFQVAQVVIGLLVSLSGSTVAENQKSSPPPLPKAGVCLREGAKHVGADPVQIGKAVRAPKKIKNVFPDWPELPPSTSVSGVWVGEVLIDRTGRVVEVWVIQPLRVQPPFPAVNEAIVTAVRQWTFEPSLVNKKLPPVCMTVTTRINLQ